MCPGRARSSRTTTATKGNNFTDEKPSVSSGGSYPVSAMGRYLYVRAKVRLADLFWAGMVSVTWRSASALRLFVGAMTAGRLSPPLRCV